MDKRTLVKEEEDAGLKLVRGLEEEGLPIAAAMWLKVPEEDWQLYISTPDVETYGPLSVYRFVDGVIRKKQVPLISVDNVSVANTTNHFLNTIANLMRVTNNIVKLKNCTFNNVYVDEAVVYKIRRGVQSSKRPPKLKTATKARPEHA